MHSHIARVCVLFEDLRIETDGIAAGDLDDVDATSKMGRQLYFLRRSFGTLHEFGEALKDLDQLPEFGPIRAKFNTLETRQWTRALKYFHDHSKSIAKVRHNVGGHFGLPAAKLAIKNLDPDTSGSVELAMYTQRGGGAKLGFAREIAATALVWNLRGRDTPAKVRRLVRMAGVAYQHATWAVYRIVSYYLWDRFGK